MDIKYYRENLEWRPVVGLEGKYEVSNYGDIHRLERKAPSGNGGYRILTDHVFWAEEQKEYGGCDPNNRYLGIHISKKLGKMYIHRIAAKAFCPNPDNKPEVNHIDGNHKNNYCGCKKNNYKDSNLEWVYHSENMKHASENNLINRDSELRKLRSKENHRIKRSVIQLDLEGNIINKYENTTEARKQLGYISNNCINRVCRGERKSYKGFRWQYVDE